MSGALSPRWRAVLRRLGDLFVVYGHGLLAYGVGRAFTGAFDTATGAAFCFGLAAHLYACYISAVLET